MRTQTEAGSHPSSSGTDAGEAFAELIGPHLNALYGYCMRLSGRPADAEDLLQETLLRGLRAASGLRAVDRMRPWLFTIATNAWRDRQRARSREVTTVPLEASDADDEFSLFATLAIEDPFPYSDELRLDFLRLFRDEDLQAAFAGITPVHRLPLILTIIHGFSCKEAAAILGIPLGTLLSRLHRGRRQLERGLWDYAVQHGLVKVSDDDDCCREAVRRMWTYLSEVLDTAERAELEEHLGVCQRCCGELEFSRELRERISQIRMDQMPDHVRSHVEEVLRRGASETGERA